MQKYMLKLLATTVNILLVRFAQQTLTCILKRLNNGVSHTPLLEQVQGNCSECIIITGHYDAIVIARVDML